MNPSRPVLTPDASAALTRLVLAYCLGRGSICLYSRSYVLQIHHQQALADYAFYQWRRVRQFLPAIKPPVHHALKPNQKGGGAQWRLRVSSRWFETAWRLLYKPDGFRVTSPVLELLGAEAIGSLWADRGRVLIPRSGERCFGRLNLSRYDWESAELVHDWIGMLTGARGRVHHSPTSVDAPMLFYDDEATQAILSAIDRTWMAQAPCLAKKFRRPAGPAPGEEERLFEQLRERAAGSPLLQPRQTLIEARPKGIQGGRTVPALALAAGADADPAEECLAEPIASAAEGIARQA